jgi:hypothetical protein
MSANEVFAVPSPISVLYAWWQGGDAEGARAFVATNIATDEGLLTTIEHLTNTVYSSDRGSYQVLKKNDLALFMDPEAAMQRVEALTQDPLLGGRAKELVDASKDGSRF